jgi:diguanylate cyclase (GGDEF)-like protein
MAPPSAADKLARSLNLIAEASRIADIDDLLRVVLKSAQETVGAEAVSLALVDEATGELYFYKFAGGSRKIRSVRLPPGRGIVGHVAATGAPLNIEDAKRCPHFFPDVDKATGFKTRQVLCVPMRARGRLIGVLEAVNKLGAGRFDAQDQLIFLTFAGHAASAIESSRLARQAFYDQLTGIRNRAFFEDWLASQWTRLGRLDKPFSLLLIDVDRFKAVNDSRGHAAGDALLRGLAELIKSLIRRSDVLARYGGDELILALPETSPARAKSAAERLRQAVSRHDFGLGLAVTISVGLSGRRRDPSQTPSGLVKECDVALYRAKATRDAVSVY